MTRASAKGRIDAHIGNQIRLRRIALHQSMEQLAEALGVTEFQVAKYENGSNRVGASLLLQISKVLQTEPATFFDGFLRDEQNPEDPTSHTEAHGGLAGDCLKLFEIFSSIKSADARARVVDFASKVAASRSAAE